MPAGSLGNEFRILDPVGADGGNTDPCLQQLDPKAAAVGIEQGLGSRVAVKERNGLKTGDRADFEDSASGLLSAYRAKAGKIVLVKDKNCPPTFLTPSYVDETIENYTPRKENILRFLGL